MGRATRRPYIWGRCVVFAVIPVLKFAKMYLSRSVHNVRIERLWVDVTAQVGATWADHFTTLEMHHGLDIINLSAGPLTRNVHFYVLVESAPNADSRWAKSLTCGYDMFVRGIRGTQLPLASTATVDDMTDEELEVYGVDWEALRDDRVLQSQRSDEGSHLLGWAVWSARKPQSGCFGLARLVPFRTADGLSQSVQPLIRLRTSFPSGQTP